MDLTYYQREENGRLEAFMKDIADGVDEATAVGDQDGAIRLQELWLDYFQVKLPAKGAVKLIAFLESRQQWRREGRWVVFKTVGEPCIAYTARIDERNWVTLIALAACYRYPFSEENWWGQVVRPRLGTM